MDEDDDTQVYKDNGDALTIAYQSGYYDGKKAAQPAQEPVAKYCCHVCFNKSGQTFLDRMIICSECGNKRCPKATNHALPCTDSNEPNQAGSVFTNTPQRPWVGLTDGEMEDTFIQCGGRWNGDYWEIEDADFHPFLRTIEAKLKEKNT